ncbi:MAG: hypothetical protein UV02_C0052G0004 [Candidatus Kuenenbacteria bacterium GW2011_GWA2_42_15]|uniref:Uncharacterized protein n=1 Tax=Candidatus Kuenenbacteria bacterium GW2011_GWA2_42_15 TaxID=1618677 RepID=A0A0G1BQZ5_9BACT|nr:MAG: hypothetical protein UV02_C0052G0004 [Candidatus Kuenenbacteria bacterium GW2011_GWA2_42_15]
MSVPLKKPEALSWLWALWPAALIPTPFRKPAVAAWAAGLSSRTSLPWKNWAWLLKLKKINTQ